MSFPLITLRLNTNDRNQKVNQFILHNKFTDHRQLTFLHSITLHTLLQYSMFATSYSDVIKGIKWITTLFTTPENSLTAFKCTNNAHTWYVCHFVCLFTFDRLFFYSCTGENRLTGRDRGKVNKAEDTLYLIILSLSFDLYLKQINKKSKTKGQNIKKFHSFLNKDYTMSI